MDVKTGVIIFTSFMTGAAMGAATTYIITKKYCDQMTQQAIEEMKVAHKQELEDIKKEAKNEPTEAGEESVREAEDDGIVKIDKPSITEMSSIVNNGASDNVQRTKYNFSDVKKAIKEAEKKVKKEKKHLVAKDYDGYMDLDIDAAGGKWNELEFQYDTDTEEWKDWNDVEYDVDNLPFDTDDVVWIDEQCYLVDDENHCSYILSKV